MSDCCGNHSDCKDKMKGSTEKPPKSFIRKYLYNLGKKDVEKEKHHAKHKGDCC